MVKVIVKTSVLLAYHFLVLLNLKIYNESCKVSRLWLFLRPEDDDCPYNNLCAPE